MFLLAAPSAKAGEMTPVTGGTAVLIVGSELQTLNPALTTGAGEQTIGCTIHEGLVDIDNDGEYVPLLAKSWTISDDERTYTFDLVKANWHDGEPFTAEDVKFSYQEVNPKYAPLFSAQIGENIESIEVLGQHKVKITLKEPFGPFLRMTACYNGGAITPKHVYEGTNPTQNPASNAPVGTGAFKFEEWKTGEYVSVVKNEDYWKEGLPYLDAMIVRFIPQGGARVQALKAGEADYVQRYFFPSSDYKTVGADPTLKLETSGNPPNSLLAFFNTTKEPFNNKKVRQALFSVVDRNFIRDAAFAGDGEPMYQPFPHGLSWVVNPKIDFNKMYPMDFDAANKILDEAGYPRGNDGTRFTVGITYESDVPERQKTAIIMQEAWKKLGVESKLEPMERNVWRPRIFNDGDFDVAITSYSTYGDPAVGISRAYLSSSIGMIFGNGSRYGDPELDALFDKAASLSSVKARGDVYRQIQEILADIMVTMPLHTRVGFDAASKRLHGVWGYEGNGHWSTAWLEE
jgi:peptide/nickel transport system substrate-binding protein